MSIKRAMFLFTLFVILGMVGLLLFSSRLLMLNSEQTEKQQIEVELRRGKTSITQQLNDLGALVTDWAGWDDPYEYITSRDEAFLVDNVDASMMQSAHLSFIAFLDNSGQVLFSRSLNSETGEEIPISESITQFLTNKKNPPLFTKNEDFRLGLVWDGNNALMIGAYPIIGNSRKRPVNGTLIMGRDLVLSVIDLGNDTFLTQSLLPVSEGLRTKSEAFQTSILAGVPVVEADKLIVAGYQAVKDVNGEITLLMKIEQPRIIVEQAIKMSVTYGILFLTLTGLFGFILLIVADRVISRPMTVLRKELTELVTLHDFGKRVRIIGLKEHQDVAKSINQLMEMNQRLAETTRAGTKKMEEQLIQIEAKNQEMENTKVAIMNILEDERELEDQLRTEKNTIEETVAERTRELVEEQAKLEGSIDSLPVGYLMIDKEGNAVMANREVRKVLGDIEMAVMVKQIKDWLSENKDIVIDEQSGLPEASVLMGGIINSHNNGYADLSVVPIQVTNDLTNAEERIGWVALISDVTEAKNLQKARDDFFSIASHELRTPLTAIRGNTALIRDYYPEIMKDESVHQIIDDIHGASIRLITIVNDFLDASRLELKKIEFKIEQFDVVPLVEKVAGDICMTAKEKQIDCGLIKREETPSLKVSADAARTEQILYNLMGNAIKFTKKGGVTIEVKRGNNKAEIWVTDSGLGIPAENQRLLFRKFQQAGESVFTREASQGSGMGLYISRLLAEGMGGNIRLESSELGKGSTFVLELATA